MKISTLLFGLLAICLPTIAFAADPVSTTVDIGTFLGAVLSYVQPIVLSVVATVFTYLSSKITPHLVAYLGQQRSLALMNQFDQLLMNGVSSGIALLRTRTEKGVTLDAKSIIVSEALRYANDHGANILNSMGKTSDSVVQSIVARLETHPALASTSTVAVSAPIVNPLTQ